MRCSQGVSTNARGCFLDVTDIYMAFEVQVDGLYGPYVRFCPSYVPVMTAGQAHLTARSLHGCGCWQGHCNPPHQNSLVGNFSCRGMGHGTPQNSSSYCYCPRTNRTVGRQHVSDQFGRYGSGFISKLSHLLDGRLLSSCKNISLSLFSLRDRDDTVQILPRKLSFKHKRNTAQCFYEWTGYWYSTPEQ
jgi:hypothetical protein